MRTVDLFSGCGGMSLGFQSAGYNIVAAFENWPAAIECYKQNFKHPVIETDLSIVDEAIIRIKKYQPDLIIGGPPCQDFSNAGNRTEGERAELTHSFAKIITAVKPKFFVMENVARASESEAYKKARKLFIDNGYGLTEIVLDASHCNVPQKRNRFFCIGGLNQDDGFLSAILRAKQTVLPLSVRDYYSEKKYTLEFEYYYRHPRSYKRRGIFSVDTPAPTIRGVNRPKPSEYKKHDSDPVDPSNIRAMTTRERARIQTFPDTFVFPENTANTEQMIGNAVPVQLATFVASSLSDFVDEKQYSCNMQFIDWLKSNKGFTNRAAGDIVSRIIRANKIVPIKQYTGFDYVNKLDSTKSFKSIKPVVQSQVKRAVRLYFEYLDISTKEPEVTLHDSGT